LPPTNHRINSKDEGSEKTEATIAFKCPSCKNIFEFDQIGENELVSCPICGSDFRTVKKGETLRLEPFEFECAASRELSRLIFPFEVELSPQGIEVKTNDS
jgi:DNA-directed RNA polymerase subunit RPC12/RpoP